MATSYPVRATSVSKSINSSTYSSIDSMYVKNEAVQIYFNNPSSPGQLAVVTAGINVFTKDDGGNTVQPTVGAFISNHLTLWDVTTPNLPKYILNGKDTAEFNAEVTLSPTAGAGASEVVELAIVRTRGATTETIEAKSNGIVKFAAAIKNAHGDQPKLVKTKFIGPIEENDIFKLMLYNPSGPTNYKIYTAKLSIRPLNTLYS